MKKNFLIVSILIIININGFSTKNIEANFDFEPFAIVELFTSQGCSSCPPADALLSRTIINATNEKKNIIALSFHVDYWNRLGWKDPFNEAKFSERQENYTKKMQLSCNYTPQMIVNGSAEFVGSNESKLNRSIREALAIPAEVSFQNTNLAINDKQIPEVYFELKGDLSNLLVNFAMVSLKEITSIKNGENSGTILTTENVVRQFFSINATPTGKISFADSPLPVIQNLAVIAYVQDKSTFKIKGAIQLSFKNLPINKLTQTIKN